MKQVLSLGDDKPKKCKIIRTDWGRQVDKCAGLQAAAEAKYLDIQCMRNETTRGMRERYVLKLDGLSKPGLVMNYCPFCRNKIDTEI